MEPQPPVTSTDPMEPSNQSVIPQQPKHKSGTPKKALLVFVVLILMAGTGLSGWVYGKSQTAKKADTQKASLQSQISSLKKSQADLKKQLNDATKAEKDKTAAAEATQLVKTFYTQYAALFSNETTAQTETQAKALVAKYGTDALVKIYSSTNKALDPIFCAQSSPNSLNVGTAQSSATGFTVSVDTIYTNNPKQTLTVQVIKNASDYKIDKVVCPST